MAGKTALSIALAGALLGGFAGAVLPTDEPASLVRVAVAGLAFGVLCVVYRRFDRFFARAGEADRAGGATRERFGFVGAFTLRVVIMLPGLLAPVAFIAALGSLGDVGVFVLVVVHALLVYITIEHAETIPPPSWVLRLEDAALRRLGAR